MGGLPKSIIKKYGITKKAWQVYREGSSKSSTKKKARKTARKKTKRRYGMTIPLAPTIGLVAMFREPIAAAMSGQTDEIIPSLVWNVIGVDSAGRFDMGKLISNVTPLIAGLLIHKFVGGAPLNLNKILARARVPFLRV